MKILEKVNTAIGRVTLSPELVLIVTQLLSNAVGA